MILGNPHFSLTIPLLLILMLFIAYSLIPIPLSFKIGLWELCSKFPSLFYSNFFSKSLHFAQFYSFYAVSITIPYLQFKLPIKVSYLMLVEPLKVLISLSLMLSLSVLNPEWETSSLSSSHSTCTITFMAACFFRIANI